MIFTQAMRSTATIAFAVLLLGATGCSSNKKTVQMQPTPAPSVRDVSASPQIRETRSGDQPSTAPAVPQFRTIYFDFDESVIRTDMRDILNNNAELLRTNSDISVLLEGHCDERGTNEYNLALGERRASAVKTYLTMYGIAADRLRTISYGEERPAAVGSTESTWSRNRRCEFTIVTSQVTSY